MKALTIRDIPEKIQKKVKQRAARRGISMNKAVISLLQETMEMKKKKKPVYHDLDHLAGVWKSQEANTFNRNLLKQRAIDKDIWK